MTLTLERVSNRSASPDAADQGTPVGESGSLVINLCKVGGPITIPQPRSPQLRRFSFFLSHDWQGSRTKYWLQMGYFSTHVEASRWLMSLRGTYPGAFVSDVSAAQAQPLSERQVLRRLEHGDADESSSANENEAGGASLLRPEETGTRHGLRPGVFSDAICAKRDAQCVDSDVELLAIMPASSQQQATPIATGPTPERRAGGTFKETLEILGTVELDGGRQNEINGTATQDLRIELQKEPPLKQISRRLSLWTRKP